MSTIKLHRVFKASPEKIFKAFIDADAQAKWLPPHGFTCKVLQFDAKVGGIYKMSFKNFTTGKSHSFGGKFLEIKPNELIRYSYKFDDPNLPGEMIITITIKQVSCWSDVTFVQENVPDLIPPEMCYLGWQDSLDQLANLVNPDISD